MEIIKYLSIYYVNFEKKIIAKWAAYYTYLINNCGFCIIFIIKSVYKKIKTYFKYGFGNIIKLVYYINKVFKFIARTAVNKKSR